jgi:glycerate kinase
VTSPPSRVLVAPDSFGGSMSATEAAAAIGTGWHKAAPDDVLTTLPMADGGPGFVQVLSAGLGGRGRLVDVPASDPLGRPVTGRLLVVDDEHGRTVYVESAQVCGLHLLAKAERDPSRTTSAGLAALLRAAVDEGAKRIVVGLGGTGTNDAGAGMLESLGVDAQRLRGVELMAATDVDIPLLGPHGATAVFGPQKGADAATLPVLEERLARFADAIAPELAELPGAGAAGGIGFGLFALGGHRTSGADLVMQVLGVSAAVAASDLVITGEGSLDAQSLQGKLPIRIAACCLEARVPCIAICGRVMLGHSQAVAAGFAETYSIEAHAGSLPAAIELGRAGLSALAEQAATAWRISRADSG